MSASATFILENKELLLAPLEWAIRYVHELCGVSRTSIYYAIALSILVFVAPLLLTLARFAKKLIESAILAIFVFFFVICISVVLPLLHHE